MTCEKTSWPTCMIAAPKFLKPGILEYPKKIEIDDTHIWAILLYITVAYITDLQVLPDSSEFPFGYFEEKLSLKAEN